METRKRRIECKPELVISSLQRFYSTYPDVAKVMPYLDGEPPLSLRIIDWFVTKYSRMSFVRYPLHGQEFLVYLSYKGQLKAYSKQYFDPNCRRERIMFKIPGHEAFMTTIGKLNFFRWALETQILDYIEAHQEEIRTGYNLYLKRSAPQEADADPVDTTDPVPANPVDTIDTTGTTTTGTANTANTATTVEGVATEPKALRTTRRRTKQSPSAINKLQFYVTPVVLDFD